MQKTKNASSILQATRDFYLRSLKTCFHWQCFSRDEHIKKDKMDVACVIHVEGWRGGKEGANTYNVLVGKPDGMNRVGHKNVQQN
jgi:hypothetical protein